METKNIHTTPKSRTGTTLVELILFIGITAMMTGVILSFSLLSAQVGLRTEVMADVEHAGIFATEYISQKVQAANSVNVSGGELTLIDGSNTVIISLENGKIKVDEDGEISYITPEEISVDKLNFVLLGATESTKDGVTISFDIKNRNAGGVLKLPNHDLSFHLTVAGR